MKYTIYNIITGKIGSVGEKYLVDGQQGILPEHLIELEVIEVDRPEITDTQIISINWNIDIENKQYIQEYIIRDKTAEELKKEYSRITRLQGLLLLNQMGYYETIVEQMKLADNQTQIAWNNAVTWEIDNSLIINFAQTLNLSDEEIFQFFKTASQIEIN